MLCIHTFVYLLYFFIFSAVMLQPVPLHTCMYVIIGRWVVQKSREASLLLFFLNLECVDLCCVLFLAVDGFDVAVDSAT